MVLHRVFFLCWHFTGSSFPAGASFGILSLLVLHKFPTLKFCHGIRTKRLPVINISQDMTPSLSQAILSSGEQSMAILFYLFFSRKQDLTFHANFPCWRKNVPKCCLLKILPSMLSVNIGLPQPFTILVLNFEQILGHLNPLPYLSLTLNKYCDTSTLYYTCPKL